MSGEAVRRAAHLADPAVAVVGIGPGSSGKAKSRVRLLGPPRDLVEAGLPMGRRLLSAEEQRRDGPRQRAIGFCTGELFSGRGLAPGSGLPRFPVAAWPRAMVRLRRPGRGLRGSRSGRSARPACGCRLDAYRIADEVVPLVSPDPKRNGPFVGVLGLPEQGTVAAALKRPAISAPTGHGRERLPLAPGVEGKASRREKCLPT